MQKTATKRHGLTRRSFLQATAATASATALWSLAGCSSEEQTPEPEGDAPVSNPPAQQVKEDKYFQCCMGNCSGWGCPFYVTVREGKVVNITKTDLKCPDGTPNPYQKVCLKGYANIQRMYSPTRVQYPMKRAGERGEGKWERISWDQAVTEITDKWKQLQADYGNNAVAFMSGSGTNMATISWTGRLQALMGAMTIAPCYDNTGMMCQWDHAGFNPYVNGQNEWRDMINSDNIFVWGTNPSESNIANFTFMSEAQKKGAKLIVIDPIYTTTASKADKFVSIRPGTDGLLACGMALVAIRDGKTDKAHLQTQTVAPFLVKDSDGLYLRLSDLGQAEAGSADDRILVYEGGEAKAFDTVADPEIEGSFTVEGVAVKPAYQILLDRLNEWDLDRIAQLTDIPVATIEELSGIYTSGLSMIYTGFGPDHYANGETAYDGMNALADITGMECKHGAGITCTDFSAAVAQGNASPATADLTDVVPGATVHAPYLHELMREGHFGALDMAPKACYFYMVNPIGNEPDRLAWIQSLNAMELIVVSEMFTTETTKWADYILPVAFLFERNDITSGFNPFVKLVEKAAEPMSESKGDFDIISELGRAMGFADKFTMTEEEYLKACVDNDAAKAAGITWDKLKSEHAIWSYPEDPVVIGLTTPPFTATGRMEFYHENIQPMAAYAGLDWDQKKMSCWFWEPPLEAWYENPIAQKFPLTFISERCKFKTHTMFNNAPMLLEIDPEPYIKVNPADAEARGIKEGDTVRLYNDRGDVTLKCYFNSGCRPGVLVIDHGWDEDHFIEGHYSDLSTSASWARYAQDNWFDCQVEMEKVQ